MDAQRYEDLKMMLCDELEQITEKGELTAGSLETVHKLTDTIKNIEKILMYDEDEEYSGRGGMWTAEGNYDRRRSRNSRAYNGGNSYRKGMSRRSYGMEDGREYLMTQLSEMIDDPNTPAQSRTSLRRAMESLTR